MKITFEEPEPGVTIVNLTHTDVPEEDRLVSLLEIFLSMVICNEYLWCLECLIAFILMYYLEGIVTTFSLFCSQ